MYHYLLPLIVAIPKGYNLCISVPINQIISRLDESIFETEIVIKCNLINDGCSILKKEKIILINNKLNQSNSENFFFENIETFENPSYVEIDIISKDKKIIFKDNFGISFYSIFSYKNKKTFLSDNAFKTGSPNVIYQISKIKRFVDTYSAINIDFKNLLGESMMFINPYKKKIACKVFDEDQNFKDIVVPSESVRELNLEYFARLKSNEIWKGHIQIYATNRLITFNYKHKLNDNSIISDFEHLDPYRLENTTYSLSELARIKLGNFIKSSKKL